MEVVKIRPIITLSTPLKNIPRTWLTTIEPKIERPEGSLCWLWTGALDTTGRPTVSVRLSNGKRSTARVSRIVAGLFYRLRRHHEVVHKCGTLNCLNPAHLYVSALQWRQEDRKKIIKETQRNIVWHIQRHELDKK